jgi:tetratricopeptide (TPR) repeat protein
MPATLSLCLKPRGATPLLLAAFLLAVIGGPGAPAKAFEQTIESPGDIEQPADVAPGSPDAGQEDELIAPDELDPETFMRPDIKPGGEDAPPPQSAEERKQDKLGRSFDDLPLPAPPEKPKMLAELYAQLGKARDEEAAAPIMEAIENLWRFSGSPTVDLLMHRAERFAKTDDLELALEIADAAVDIAPEEAEAWYIRAKVHALKKDYGDAIADLRRALDRDPKHYGAMHDLGAALEATGAKNEALEAYGKAIALNPFLGETKRAAEELRRQIEGRDI